MPEHKSNKFDQRKMENILKSENQFINNLFSVLALPQNRNDEETDEETLVEKPQLIKEKTTRATSLVELRNRIEKLKNKNKATYKEKLQKKNLKNRLKKKIKQEKRNSTHKQIRANKLEEKSSVKTEDQYETSTKKTKPIFNKDGKMMFSKIGFAGLGKEKRKKGEKDPKKVLEQVKQVDDKIQKLKQTGQIEKAKEIKEKNTWKNALAKAQGVKVKDDPVLLKKSIQKIEQKKRSSKKKWENRLDGVKKTKDERQKKRSENIQKRKKDHKLHKMKKAAKRGRIIPGL